MQQPASADTVVSDYSGRWHLTYWYPSNDSPGSEETSQYDVEAEQTAAQLTLQSVPDDTGSYLFARLYIDDIYVSGSWTETTEPRGAFKGMIYSGVVQLIVADDGQILRGKWAGTGRDLETSRPDVYTGDFELRRI